MTEKVIGPSIPNGWTHSPLLLLLRLLHCIVRGLEALVRLVQRGLLALLVLPVRLAVLELLEAQARQVVQAHQAQQDQQAAQAQAALKARQVLLAQRVRQAQQARQGYRG